MKYVSMVLALLVSTASFASDQATVINDTKTNINFQYLICKGNDCDGSGGAHSFFTDESTHFLINLKPNQNIRIQYAEEIDYKNGDPIPNGAKGSFEFNECIAYAGQTLRLVPGLIGRSKGTIFCQAE